MNDINTLVSPPRATDRSARSGTVPITVAYGDGIGPEIMEASLRVLLAGGADIAPAAICVSGEFKNLSTGPCSCGCITWERICEMSIGCPCGIAGPLMSAGMRLDSFGCNGRLPTMSGNPNLRT